MFKEAAARQEVAVVTVMSKSKTQRKLLQKLNLDPHLLFAPALRSLTIGRSYSRLKGENAELGQLFIKLMPLLFKIFEQVAARLPPSFGGLLMPAVTPKNKAETLLSTPFLLCPVVRPHCRKVTPDEGQAEA